VSMALADAVSAAGGTVRLSAPAVAIETAGDRVTAVRYRAGDRVERIACDQCLSTIPITDLARALDPGAPVEVLTAADRLRYRALVVYGLLVRRSRVLNALYVYYRDRVFHRLAEPAASGMVVRPDGHTVLLVEMTCDVGDDCWVGGEATRRQIVRDLEAEGLLAGDEIAAIHVLRAEHGYPVFDLGFEPHLATIERHLDRFANLYSTGRQGAFSYPNMHGAMRMGAEAAREILSVRHHVYPGGWRQPLIDEGGLALSDGDMMETARDEPVVRGVP
jgi:protoporphyrinogen oxidase